MPRTLGQLIFLIVWAYIGHLIFGHEFSAVTILGTIAFVGLYEIIRPFIHVVICNFRKVPYNGKAGSDRRSQAGPGRG